MKLTSFNAADYLKDEASLTAFLEETVRLHKEQLDSLLPGWRWLSYIFNTSVGSGVEVNDDALVYQQCDPGKRVRIYWYPNSPVGFNEVFGASFEEALENGVREFPNG